jgi:hypothetical protein
MFQDSESKSRGSMSGVRFKIHVEELGMMMTGSSSNRQQAEKRGQEGRDVRR